MCKRKDKQDEWPDDVQIDEDAFEEIPETGWFGLFRKSGGSQS